MEDYSLQHKKAWEFDAYRFWVRTSGTPAERAAKDKADPVRMLKQHAAYFDSFEGVRVANICGSCGKKAIPLALLGADVTVFDISEDNKRYAMETAEAAGVSIHFEVCDILEINRDTYNGYFDVVFMEGGVLHYFHDINEFMGIMNELLKSGGKLICSDFHPFTKISDILKFGQPTPGYFYTEVFEGEMAHARFYDEETRKQIPKCRYRKYTISEIINGIIQAGFTLERFDEHPAWEDEKLPGEFTAVARKSERDYRIRPLREDETGLLKDFLYEAIFLPEGVEPPARDIVEKPELRVYTDDFGTGKGDHCLVADLDGKVVGAVWTRIMDDYGHVDDETPSFAISLYREYRGRGIGTELMMRMLKLLKRQGYTKASLAVQKANYAVKMYEKVGFRTVDENDEEYIMVCEL